MIQWIRERTGPLRATEELDCRRLERRWFKITGAGHKDAPARQILSLLPAIGSEHPDNAEYVATEVESYTWAAELLGRVDYRPLSPYKMNNAMQVYREPLP